MAHGVSYFRRVFRSPSSIVRVRPSRSCLWHTTGASLSTGVNADETRFGEEHFVPLWKHVAGGNDSYARKAFRKLRRQHDQFWRVYHDADHVGHVLGELELVADELHDPDAVRIAAYFYVPWLPRNQERSAALARRWLVKAGAEPECVEAVERHILATRHQEEPQDSDAAYLIDADLAILGRDPDRYAWYERQIRREYCWLPRGMYEKGRRSVVRGFLERARIYWTEIFWERYEEKAHRNLD